MGIPFLDPLHGKRLCVELLGFAGIVPTERLMYFNSLMWFLAARVNEWRQHDPTEGKRQKLPLSRNSFSLLKIDNCSYVDSVAAPHRIARDDRAFQAERGAVPSLLTLNHFLTTPVKSLCWRDRVRPKRRIPGPFAEPASSGRESAVAKKDADKKPKKTTKRKNPPKAVKSCCRRRRQEKVQQENDHHHCGGGVSWF